MGLHSTYGGPDSLGGADADQENAILAKRVLFRKMDNMRGGQIDWSAIRVANLNFVESYGISPKNVVV